MSHNMGAVQRLCQRVILLETGKLKVDSDTGTTVNYYYAGLEGFEKKNSLYDVPREAAEWGKLIRLTNVTVLDSHEKHVSVLDLGAPFRIQAEFICLADMKGISVIIGIDTIDGIRVTTVASEETINLFDCKKGDSIKVEAAFDDLVLNSGRYFVRVGARSMSSALDLLRQASYFDIGDSRHPRTRQLQSLQCLVRSSPKWKCTK